MTFSSMMGALLMTMGMTAFAADLPALSHSLTKQAAKTPAPVLALKDLDGQLHDLASLKGKVVLVNFWATWCPPCRREMPSMDRLARKLAGTPFAVLAVDIGEDADTIHTFISQLDATPSFPILLDPHARIMQTWKISGLPTTYLIDPQGRIAYSAVGGREFDHPEIERQVRALLKP
jgi:thiol-disulfide isomerase/thioredoxin